MARHLTADEWDAARAIYEVEGKSLREVAARTGVAFAVVQRRSKRDSWDQGSKCHIVAKKVKALKEIAEANRDMSQLSTPFQVSIDRAIRKQLQADEALADFDLGLIAKGRQLLEQIDGPSDWETMTRGRRNMAYKPTKSETNINQQQAQQTTVAGATPTERMRAILAQCDEIDRNADHQ